MCDCFLKVITFYEPLKPFMAIVIEVTVLVAAILLYERCRSRKTPPAGISVLIGRDDCVHVCGRGSTLTVCVFAGSDDSDQTNTL